MGILKEMFDENGDESINEREPVELAVGCYRNIPENVMKGYKIFQKKYVYKNLALKIVLVLAATASSVLMLIDPQNGDYSLPIMCLMACLAIGIYFVLEPINNRKKVKKSVEEYDDAEYTAEITDMTIKISTNEEVTEEKVENKAENSEKTQDKTAEHEDEEAESENCEDDEEIPATVIHLNSPVVEIVDTDELFVVCVKKSYVFIIPKSAFETDKVQNIREKLSAIMGIRYTCLEK